MMNKMVQRHPAKQKLHKVGTGNLAKQKLLEVAT